MISGPLGRALLQAALPKGFSFPDGPVTKKVLHSVLLQVAQKNPQDYPEVATKIKRFGDAAATFEGVSAGLDDIAPTKEILAIREPLFQRAKNAKTVDEKRKILAEGQKALVDVASRHPGDFGIMARSGGRGNMAQLQKTVVSPFLATRSDGTIIPWAVHHSYSEGVSPASAWSTAEESRANAVTTKLSVVEPGEIGKLLLQSMYDQPIVEEDCKTTNGIVLQHDDPNILDRFLAHGNSLFKAGTLITPDVASQIKKLGKPVVVRSPITCSHTQGLCKKCYGLTEKGKLPEIGWNMGVRAAQAASEVLTQTSLSAKHAVRLLEAHDQPVGLKAIKQLLEIPESFSYGAILAEKPGRVETIETAPQGGYYVNIGGETQYVSPGLKLKVNVGDNLEAGEPLSEGIHKPDDVVRLRGPGEGRLAMANSLYDAYAASGTMLDRRHPEMIAKSTIRYAIVEDDPRNRFTSGDVIDYEALKERLEDSAKTINTEDAAGHVLAKDYLSFSAGTEVTPKTIQALKAQSIEKVDIAVDPPKVNFFMKSVAFNPSLLSDWLAKMGHRDLKDVMQKAVQIGEKSNIHGLHPTPGIAYGAEFGKTGPKGQY